jgi:hypothetical protein
MPRVSASEIVTQNHVRFFVQPGGAGPRNAVLYSGQEASYMNIESVDNPVRGGISPINVQSPYVPGEYRRVGRKVEAADFPSATVSFLQRRNVLPRHLTELESCAHTFYAATGDCRDLSTFDTGWSAYMKIMSFGEATTRKEALSSWDSGDQIQDDIDFIFAAVYNAGAVSIGEKAANEVYSQVVDATYGGGVSCGNCGPADGGTNLVYAVTNNTVASPGQAPSIVYSLNGGVTVHVAPITSSVANDTPVAIRVMGSFLVVLTKNTVAGNGAIFYAEINPITGVPGTFNKVTAGFVAAGKLPTDMHVVSASEAYISATDGFIFRLSSLNSGVELVEAGNASTSDLNRIHGDGNDTIVAAGEAGTVVYSVNRGRTWAKAQAVSDDDITALNVRNPYLWWVGNEQGELFFTEDQGDTWFSYAWNTNAAQIDDITFATDEVGWISHRTASPTAVISATLNGGRTWTSGVQRILNTPVFDVANRIVVPRVAKPNITANNLLIAGLAGNGSDGILLVGAASVI